MFPFWLCRFFSSSSPPFSFLVITGLCSFCFLLRVCLLFELSCFFAPMLLLFSPSLYVASSRARYRPRICALCLFVPTTDVLHRLFFICNCIRTGVYFFLHFPSCRNGRRVYAKFRTHFLVPHEFYRARDNKRKRHVVSPRKEMCIENMKWLGKHACLKLSMVLQ